MTQQIFPKLLIERPVNFEQDFRALLDGIVEKPDQLIQAARKRYVELRQPNHETMQGQTQLEKRWYSSLIYSKPDYGVYLDDEYLAEAWVCWLFYSREALKKISAPKSLPNGGSILADLHSIGIASIADLGCGIGFTTAALTELFPGAHVTGTNLLDCVQYQIAARLGATYGFKMFGNVADIGHPVDLVFASEYFEHFQEPVKHLLEVLNALHPRALIIANAFNVPSTGHFPYYDIGRTRVSGKQVGRIFNNTLRAWGYEKIETKLWNNRPAYWRKRV